MRKAGAVPKVVLPSKGRRAPGGDADALPVSHDGRGMRIGVVVARFNEAITSRLLDGARDALAECGVAKRGVTVAYVPGSFELPVAAKVMAQSGRFDAVVCLGAVIKGETDHYEHVAGQAARGIARAALDTGVPVAFGVLTTRTKAHAEARAGGAHGNVGRDAALAAVETANVLKGLRRKTSSVQKKFPRTPSR
jgi:6,7-dimethyl-8-ribityllumazine synthase